MLQYDFMVRALIVGTLLSLIIPLIGIIMINRNTSMIGDALSHTALSGIALGLILGVNPVWTSLIICIIAAFLIELIRNRFSAYGDMATAIVMSGGIGLAAILSDFTPGGTSFTSFLFGSISTVSSTDVWVVLVISTLVLSFSFIYFWALLYSTINPTLARIAGVRVEWINSLFTLITATTVAISAKTIGALMVTSLMVIPVATALVIGKSYRQTYFFAIFFSFIAMMSGMILSFYRGFSPGGSIVIIAVGIFLLTIVISLVTKKVHLTFQKNK